VEVGFFFYEDLCSNHLEVLKDIDVLVDCWFLFEILLVFLTGQLFLPLCLFVSPSRFFLSCPPPPFSCGFCVKFDTIT